MAPCPRRHRCAALHLLLVSSAVVLGSGADDELRWLAVGDAGLPGEPLRAVALEMSRVADVSKPAFGLLLGDNFYPAGVQHAADPLFEQAFDDVYTSPSLLPLLFYTVLGNHDWLGNAEAQLERFYNRPSSRMVLPHYWYSRRFGAGSFTALFVFLDTMVLGGKLGRLQSLAQLDWLRQTLREASDRWIVVVGHHPIYSAGSHGDTEHLVQSVLPLLEEYGVDLYLCGHDHDQQVLGRSSNVSMILTGSGSKQRPSPAKPHHSELHFATSEHGFASFAVNATHLSERLHSSGGRVLWEGSRPPRPKVAQVVGSDAAYLPLVSEELSRLRPGFATHSAGIGDASLKLLALVCGVSVAAGVLLGRRCVRRDADVKQGAASEGTWSEEDGRAAPSISPDAQNLGASAAKAAE